VTITLVAMAVILIAGVSVMVVATVAHVLDRSRRLRLWFRARYVALAAWSCRVRRLTGHRLGRIASTTHWPGNRAVG
jgi:hypothetical protein